MILIACNRLWALRTSNIAENEKTIQTQKCADLSFTPFGMADVLERSQNLQEEHQNELRFTM
jgi:hypothetical protein